MQTRNIVRGTCNICKWETEASDQGQVNRNLGWHKRTAHGIVGESSTPEGKRIRARARHWRNAGMSEAQIARREAEFQAKHGSNSTPQTNHEPTPSRKAPKVTESIEMVFICPKCHARVYVAEH